MNLNKIVPSVLILLFVASCDSPEQVKHKKYFVAGQRIYKEQCSNCHGADGIGFRGLFPNINRPELYEKDLNELICLISQGSRGVDSRKNNVVGPPMPAIQLSKLELAELVTYLSSEFGMNTNLFDVKQVENALDYCNK